jgi:hypothetical protein
MGADGPIVVRLEAPAGSDGFWPRENYFAGGAENGYAIAVRSAAPVTVTPGRTFQLEVANHLPHLPYRYEGAPTTLAPDAPSLLVFQWGGRVMPIGTREVDSVVQHRFDPDGTTETAAGAVAPCSTTAR